MRALEVIVAPTTEPVSLEEAMLWVREDRQEAEPEITALIKAARERAELETGRALITQTIRLTLDDFPMSSDGMIYLPRSPIQSVSSVVYLDSLNTQQTLATTEYETDLRSMPARIVPAYGKSWPSIIDRLNALTITYIAGYGDAAAVPASIKVAMRLMMAHWYAHREEVAHYNLQAKPIPLGACTLLRGFWVGEYR